MNIYFVETEQAEQEYFASELGGHQLHFVERLDEVENDAEILSTFIYSQIDRAASSSQAWGAMEKTRLPNTHSR
jgi:hypothetical protein